MLFLRSLVFNLIYVSTVIPFALLVALTAPFHREWGVWLATAWARLVFWSLKYVCRIDWRIEGAENIPTEPAIAYWKHQSAWETLAQLLVFPKQSWVLKHELMWIPLIGQALMTIKPIPIDRGSGQTAVKQVLNIGSERLLKDGMWVMIFPEGTRMPPGTTRRYGISGALLAEKTGRPIVPVAHNAGDYWRRNAFLKYPGTIRVRVGKPVYPHGLKPEDMNREIQDWVEAQMKEISPGYEGRVLEKRSRR